MRTLGGLSYVHVMRTGGLLPLRLSNIPTFSSTPTFQCHQASVQYHIHITLSLILTTETPRENLQALPQSPKTHPFSTLLRKTFSHCAALLLQQCTPAGNSHKPKLILLHLLHHEQEQIHTFLPELLLESCWNNAVADCLSCLLQTRLTCPVNQFPVSQDHRTSQMCLVIQARAMAFPAHLLRETVEVYTTKCHTMKTVNATCMLLLPHPKRINERIHRILISTNGIRITVKSIPIPNHNAREEEVES